MRNDKLNRLGDTAFRIKNQLNFYITLITYICRDKLIKPVDIYDKLIQDNVIRYNSQSKIPPTNRINFALKQLKLFNLIDYSDSIEIKGKLETVYSYLSDREKNLNFWNFTSFDLNKVIFAILLILGKNKINKTFSNFVNFLYKRFNNDFNKITKNQIALFSICDDIKDLELHWNSSPYEIITELFPEIKTTELEKIIYTKNDTNFIEDKLFSNTNWIKFKKPSNYFRNTIKIIQFYKDNKDEENILQAIKNLKLHNFFNAIRSFFNLENNDVELVKQYDLNLINMAYQTLKYQLIYGDYEDINERWFINLGMISIINVNEFEVNLPYLQLYQFIANNFNEEADIKQIIEKIDSLKLKNKKQTQVYPFALQQIIDALDLFWQNRHNNNFIQNELNKKLDIFQVPSYLIYEYLVNLAFAISYGYSAQDFRNICANTILDEELKPINQATGKKSDGLIKETINSPFSTIESTILNNSMLYKEYEPIQRHSIEYKKHLSNKYNEIPNVFFVYNDDYDLSNLILFSSKRYANYIHELDQDKEIRIISLNTKTFTDLLRKDKCKCLLTTALNSFPVLELKSIAQYEGIFQKI